MRLIGDLLATLPDGPVQDIRIGAFWTAVMVEVNGQTRCGLASTLRRGDNHHHSGRPAVRDAGSLLQHSGRELAGLARSYQPLETTIGMATINALLPRQEERWLDLNAAAVIARRGRAAQIPDPWRHNLLPQFAVG